mgnify:FL=1
MDIPAIVAQKLEEKLSGKGLWCVGCGEVATWQLAPGFVNILLQKDLGNGLVIGGPTMPAVALVCTGCGNTLIFNLKVLGVTTAIEEKAKEESISKKLLEQVFPAEETTD